MVGLGRHLGGGLERLFWTVWLNIWTGHVGCMREPNDMLELVETGNAMPHVLKVPSDC